MDVEIDDEQLIELIRKHRILYVRGVIGYSDKKKRAEAWSTISKTLQCPESICQSRWRVIRDRYVRIRSKVSTNPGSVECKWDLFDQLKFLDDYVVPRGSYCIRGKIKIENESENENENEYSSTEPKKRKFDTSPVIKTEKIDYNEDNLSEEENLVNDAETDTEEMDEEGEQNDEKDDDDPLDNKESDELINFMENVNAMMKKRVIEKDRNESFLRLVGDKLAELTIPEQENAKISILNYLFQRAKRRRH